MKRIIGLMLYGLILFGVAAGGAWFLKTQQLGAVPAGTADGSTDPDDVSALFTPPDPLLQPEVDPASDMLPVAVRPQAMSVEEIVRYGLGLKAREESMLKREDALQRAESQHRLVLADIHGEQKEIEGLLAQARDQKQAAEQLLQQTAAERKQLEAERAEYEETKAAAPPAAAAPSADRQANIKDLTEVIQGMSPEGAGGIMKEWANDGKIEMAVEILSKLEERNAAKILDSLGGTDDRQLQGELLEKFLELKRPTKPVTRR